MSEPSQNWAKDLVYGLQEMANEMKELKKQTATNCSKLDSMQEQINDLATKEQLNDLATKEQLNDLATKEQLNDLATKEQLNDLATKEQLNDLKNMVDQSYQSFHKYGTDIGIIKARLDQHKIPR